MSGAAWTVLAAIALLWPSRVVGVLDGAPLDGLAEALLVGLVLPALWWLDRRILTHAVTRMLIGSLLLWKLLLAGVATQQGLCVAAFATDPIDGINMGIPIVEPSGALRSWDVRADWRAPQPGCTAILTRPLPTQAAFPAWFLNVTDLILGKRDVTMAVRGWVTIDRPRTLTIAVDRDVQLSGRINGAELGLAPLPLAAGSHQVDLTMQLTGNDWRFDPRLDGESLWANAVTTTAPPTGVDRLLASWAWLVSPVLVAGLLGVWMRGLLSALSRQPWALRAWLVAAPLAAVVLALWMEPRFHRAAGVLTLGAVLVPVAAPLRNLRGAFLLVGVPWLAFFGAWSLAQVGHFSIYSYDDWLTYQVAGYRIFMHGYWLEGGNAVFDFQPLYRWITGVFHLAFGDSSVGEVYWDAACLLMGALLAFQCVRSRAGFRAGILASALTLSTFTVGTIWYFPGRGLSEIAAAGWAFMALFFLLRARRGRLGWAYGAAVAAVLMFYTRLNHLLLPAFMWAMLLPLSVPFSWPHLARGIARVRRMPALILAGGFSLGVLAFMWRTWYYTGVFSLFHGTSLRHNDTGLRPWTLFDGEAWAKVGHSLATLVMMNEPPRFDPRALVMMAGAAVLIAAVVQAPIARRLPAAVVIMAAGSSAAAFLAHAHGYPGRFSILSVPFASALSVLFLAAMRTPPGQRG